MKKNKFCSVISVMLATLMLLLCSGITVYSATPDCSVLLHYELSDVNFQLYRVGEITSDGVKAVKPFDAYQVDLYDEFAAYTLSGYVVKDKTAPTVETVTNDRGYATVDGLDEGVYLLMGNNSVYDSIFYSVMPSIFSLSKDEGGRVELEVKYSKSTTSIISMLNCLKIWEDNADQHPEITACLLCDGKIYDKVTLSEKNDWKNSWKDLDPFHDWQIVEDPVPEGYTVSVNRDEYTFIIKNKGEDSENPTETVQPSTAPTQPGTDVSKNPTEPSSKNNNNPTTKSNSSNSSSSSKIPQTGQLNWPVAALTVLGIILCLIGVLSFRRKRDEKE